MKLKENLLSFVAMTAVSFALTACEKQSPWQAEKTPAIQSLQTGTRDKIRDTFPLNSKSKLSDEDILTAIPKESDYQKKVALCFTLIQQTTDVASLQRLIESCPDPLIRNDALKKITVLSDIRHIKMLKWYYEDEIFKSDDTKLKIFRKLIEVSTQTDDIEWLKKEFSRNRRLFRFEGGGEERVVLWEIIKGKEKNLPRKLIK